MVLKLMSWHFMTGENTNFYYAKVKRARCWQNVYTDSYIYLNIYNEQETSKSLIHIYIYIFIYVYLYV